MEPDWFAIQMVTALGSLSGTGIGLLIGLALGEQNNRWSAMTSHEKLITIALVTLFSVICIGTLALYAFAGGQE